MENQLFDNHAETYEQSLSKSTKWVSSDTNYFAEHKIRQIKHHLSYKPTRILDYGCGIGRNIPFLQTFFPGASCYGCDISEKSLEVARSHHPNATFFKNGSLEAIATFDLIVVANVFHHVVPEERDSVIKELRELLAPRGTVFVFEHNLYNPLTRHSVKQCPFDADAHLVSSRALATLFLNAGCLIMRRKYTLFFPKWVSVLSASEPYLGWLPLGAQYFIQVAKGN